MCCRCIKECPYGFKALCADSLKLLDEMKRNDDNRRNDNVTHIVSSNEAVDLENARRLQRQPGDLWISKSSDVGCGRILDKISNCRKVLMLKVGAPVIVTKNIEGIAFNGARGTVVGLSEKEDITVKLDGYGLKKLNKVLFSRVDNGKVHTRMQYPILLAYALTVHRVQGLTLSRVSINARGMHCSMQFGVALSRATSPNHISISNLDWKSMKPMPSELETFLQTGETPPLVC